MGMNPAASFLAVGLPKDLLPIWPLDNADDSIHSDRQFDSRRAKQGLIAHCWQEFLTQK
jgi:hypothetical protein